MQSSSSRQDPGLGAGWTQRESFSSWQICLIGLCCTSVIVRAVINGLVCDGATKDPMQQAVRDALIAFMSATAQAQAEATKEAQRAGIAHAKARDDAYRGRKPSYTRAQLDAVRAQIAQGASVSAAARDAGLSRQTVYRIESDTAEAEAALARWDA